MTGRQTLGFIISLVGIILLWDAAGFKIAALIWVIMVGDNLMMNGQKKG